MWISGNAKWISGFQCGFQETLSGFQVSNVDFHFFRVPNLSKQTMTAEEFTEGATLSSSDFVEVRIKEVKKILFGWN